MKVERRRRGKAVENVIAKPLTARERKFCNLTFPPKSSCGILNVMEKNCRKCHFLCKTHRSENGQTNIFSWNKEERSTRKIKDYYAASCYLGVWDTGTDPSLNGELTDVIEKNRKENCFFLEENLGMSFQAAKTLQERKHQNEQLKTSNLYTRMGLWIAAIALFANAIVEIYKIKNP